ncbi:MAG: DegV family protein [Acholeplasmataceae bacterium]|jgi:DegV family protein with EDD domain|nr:DegV family protein [Acholeplasmataceae bacterium]MDD4194222.1 DegV family protein [Acholeplasmataceae bacterium]MDY0338832.1 DegV family protein [Acholeplasmataceae bacterium]
MKRTVGLIVDSTFGMDKSYAKTEHITIVPLKVLIGNEEYIDGTFDPEIAIQAMKDGLQIKTSQPSPEVFMEAFKEQLEMFDEVLCLTLSKSLSGTFNAATLAKTIFENPHVHVVDSETTISGGTYLAQKMVEFFEGGHKITEGLAYLELLKEKGSLIFTVDNLQTLVRNGRLGKVSAFIGNILKVKPILRFRRGVLELEHKVRSHQNVLLYLVEEVKKMLETNPVEVIIDYVDQSVSAKELQHAIYNLGDKVKVKLAGIVSPVISAHIGLGGLGVYLTYQ